MVAVAGVTEILAWLEDVKDPEIPVLSIIDLGIVRAVRQDDGHLTVVITPTYTGCPAMGVIESEIKAALLDHGIEQQRSRSASPRPGPPTG